MSNSHKTHQDTDVLICGAGCAGSLLAWILARQGLDVTLVDQSQHPRFAIGESSTPLADLILERMADRFGLPELAPLARWGSWQKHYPHLRCGKKRGFSYFGHQPGKAFSDTPQHQHSYLVAASAADAVSDTHWLRSDVDQWLCQQAVSAGVRYYDNTRVAVVPSSTDGWLIEGQQASVRQSWHASWCIDASGAGGWLPRTLGVSRADDQLRTRTGTLFGHFTGVQPMTRWLQQHGAGADEQEPFDADDAAQHHVLRDGWMWMLRFACGITSVGVTRPSPLWPSACNDPRQRWSVWQQLLDDYPTLQTLMAGSRLVDPRAEGATEPGLGWIPRISRLWRAAGGSRWLALPATVGVIDPLHSTGLAHTLFGVDRAAELLLSDWGSAAQSRLLSDYIEDRLEEVQWIDQLVAICYAALPDFELFTAVSSLYFVAAIASEHELSESGMLTHGFLGHRSSAWRELAAWVWSELQSREPHESEHGRRRFIDRLRQRIEPWNHVGLLAPEMHNRLARTVAPK